jgi:hypothetical protein
MAHNEGDPCPHCGIGHLRVHTVKKIRKDPSGFASHRTWMCDRCGETTRDIVLGIIDNVTITDKLSGSKTRQYYKKNPKLAAISGCIWFVSSIIGYVIGSVVGLVVGLTLGGLNFVIPPYITKVRETEKF